MRTMTGLNDACLIVLENLIFRLRDLGGKLSSPEANKPHYPWISILFHNNANTSPMGRVKCTSNHSSVSSDLNDNLNNSLNVAIIIFNV